MENVNVRNLEDIQEDDRNRRSSRLGMLLLTSMGVGALAVVGYMSRENAGPPKESEDEALAELVESHRGQAGEVAPDSLDGSEATFASILSDEPNPTTSFAAVKDERGRLVQQRRTDSEQPLLPPLAADKLPVVPLPAAEVLNATTVTTEPKDSMTLLAAKVSRLDANAVEAPIGTEGKFQIQVASFKEREDAERFAKELRQRGHSAYRQPADVPRRGIWHRVRIGPFENKFQAELYRKKLESKERTAAFVVDPQKVENAEQIRAAKLAVRAKRDGNGD